MMTLLLTLALAAAQDTAPGDRVEITFASGGTVIGTIVATPKTAPATALTLDLSSEYGLTGTLSVPKGDVRNIRRLRPMLKPVIGDPVPQTDPVPPPAPKPVVVTPEPPKPEVVVPDELQKAREFYAKFPAPDWSVERRNAIRLKKYRGQIPTPTEREFEAGFELWEKGRAATPR